MDKRKAEAVAGKCATGRILRKRKWAQWDGLTSHPEGKVTCSGHTDRRTHVATEKSLPPGEKQGTLKNLVLRFILSQSLCHSLFLPLGVCLCWGRCMCIWIWLWVPKDPRVSIFEGFESHGAGIRGGYKPAACHRCWELNPDLLEKEKKNYKCS